jgi:hypothetical protein
MNAGDWIQAVIAVVSIGALGGVIFSVWSLKAATFASVYQGIAGQMHDLDRLFVERPDLRPHFYGKKDLPDDERERDRVLATAELIVDFADNFVAQSPLLPSQYTRAYSDYFRDLNRTSPAIRHFWAECGKWYCDDHDDALKELFGEPGLKDSTSTPAPSRPESYQRA